MAGRVEQRHLATKRMAQHGVERESQGPAESVDICRGGVQGVGRRKALRVTVQPQIGQHDAPFRTCLDKTACDRSPVPSGSERPVEGH